MMETSDIRIFLADRRRIARDKDREGLLTLSSSKTDKERSVFGLRTFGEFTQRPSSVTNHTMSVTGALFVLPLVGRVTVGDGHVVEAGQLLKVSAVAGDQLPIGNSFPEDWVVYVLWEIESSDAQATLLADFDVESSIGKLMVIPFTERIVQLGMFNGREEHAETFSGSENKFVFVVEGAFEVEKRLLHARDALCLPASCSLEFEALSNRAIILVLTLD